MDMLAAKNIQAIQYDIIIVYYRGSTQQFNRVILY